MNIASMVPVMDDADLSALRANTKRLSEAGTPAQQAAAAALSPVIEAEFGARQNAKLSKKAEALAARKARKAGAGAGAA